MNRTIMMIIGIVFLIWCVFGGVVFEAYLDIERWTVKNDGKGNMLYSVEYLFAANPH